jgi:hypothetical protein
MLRKVQKEKRKKKNKSNEGGTGSEAVEKTQQFHFQYQKREVKQNSSTL